MSGSNNFSTYKSADEGKLGQLQPLDLSSMATQYLTYLQDRNLGYNRRTLRLIAGKDNFISGILEDNPDYDYVRKTLRSQGLTRRATKQAMKDPLFWRNIRNTYGKKPEAPVAAPLTLNITAQPLDANEAVLRDRMDAEALAHEKAGDIYNPETNTWTPKAPEEPEVALDDLRSIGKFGQAFAEARRRGLKLFMWGNKGMIYGTKLASEVRKPATQQTRKLSTVNTTSQPTAQNTKKVQRTADGNYIMSKDYYKSMIDRGFTWGSKSKLWKAPLRNYTTPVPKQWTAKNDAIHDYRLDVVLYHQQGGKINNDTQKQFMAYLIQVSGALNEQELTDFIQSLEEDGLKEQYQNFVKAMQEGTPSAKNGAKLNYIKSLRGKCPEGFELGYFKEGGQICAKCVEKNEKLGALSFRPIQGEKGTKVVQDFKKELKGKKDKITLPKKKVQKDELGGVITINPLLLEAFKCGGKMNKKENGGLVKKNKGIPIKEKFIDKDKCGGKAKKKKN